MGRAAVHLRVGVVGVRRRVARAPPKPDVRNAKCAPEIGEAASAMRGATIGATVNACRRESGVRPRISTRRM